MNEIILKKDVLNNEVMFDGKNIYFAHGEESFSWAGVFTFLALLAFAFVLSFFQFVTEKISFLSSDFQFYLAFALSLVLCIGAPILIYRKITLPIKVPTPERKNVITIDCSSKKVTIKEQNKIVDTYTFGKDDYFWYPKPSRSKNITSYSIVFVHNNTQYATIGYGSHGDLVELRRRLGELGFPLRDDNV